ncbi:MAG: hypothetical protein AAF525_21545 [Pseudomonadota bacterium]
MQIVDGGTMAFAAYHALKGKVRYPLTHQLPLMLLKMAKESDDSLVVCWDGEDLWKRKLWPAYRDRPEIWEEASAFDFNTAFSVLNAFGVVQFRTEGIEADEQVAALVHVLDGHEPLLIRSDDKDFMQLLSETTWMHGRVRGVVRPVDVKRLLNVSVDQVVDFLALTGDKVDGIPPVASEAETLQILHRCGSVSGWLYDENPPQDVTRIVERTKRQLEVNLRLVDLSADASPPKSLAFQLRPQVIGFGDTRKATDTGRQFKINHLLDDSLMPLLESGLVTLERLSQAGLLESGRAG